MIILIFKGMGLVHEFPFGFQPIFTLVSRDGNRTVTSHVGYNKDPQNGLVMPLRLGGAIPTQGVFSLLSKAPALRFGRCFPAALGKISLLEK